MDRGKMMDLQEISIKRMLEKLSDSEREIFWKRAESMNLDGVTERETVMIEAIQRIISERIIKGKCDLCERVDGCLLTTGQRGLCGGPFISFNEYRQKYPVDEDKAGGITHFLTAYRKHRGSDHPNLNPEQWKSVVDTLFDVPDHYKKIKSITLDELKEFIVSYFEIVFRDGSNYSILHFNNPGVKMRRYYEQR